MTLDFHISCNV